MYERRKKSLSVTLLHGGYIEPTLRRSWARQYLSRIIFKEGLTVTKAEVLSPLQEVSNDS